MFEIAIKNREYSTQIKNPQKRQAKTCMGGHFPAISQIHVFSSKL